MHVHHLSKFIFLSKFHFLPPRWLSITHSTGVNINPSSTASQLQHNFHTSIFPCAVAKTNPLNPELSSRPYFYHLSETIRLQIGNASAETINETPCTKLDPNKEKRGRSTRARPANKLLCSQIQSINQSINPPKPKPRTASSTQPQLVSNSLFSYTHFAKSRSFLSNSNSLFC